MTPGTAQLTLERLYEDVARRVQAAPSAICPIDMAASFVKVCQAQSCGKCVPCRVGLNNLVNLMESVLDGKAKMGTVALIENTAQVISDTADCAIGYGAADYILHSIKAFRKAVKDSSDGRVLCLMKHPTWNCLVGFGLSRKEELEAQLDREEDRATALNKDFDRDTRASTESATTIGLARDTPGGGVLASAP